jgi:hypothetical protein
MVLIDHGALTSALYLTGVVDRDERRWLKSTQPASRVARNG